MPSLTVRKLVRATTSNAKHVYHKPYLFDFHDQENVMPGSRGCLNPCECSWEGSIQLQKIWKVPGGSRHQLPHGATYIAFSATKNTKDMKVGRCIMSYAKVKASTDCMTPSREYGGQLTTMIVPKLAKTPPRNNQLLRTLIAVRREGSVN